MALPLIDALLSPVAALLVMVLLPFATARLLGWAYLGDLPAEGEERRRRLVPFRRAAAVAGLAQVQLAWIAGVTRLGPTLVDEPGGPLSLLLGAIYATIAFLSGGVARRTEEPVDTRRSVMSALMLRLRIVPFVAAPVVVGIATTRLPLVVDAGDALAVSWGYAALAFALCFAAVAYGGLALSLATRALRRADAALSRRVSAAAQREGIDRVLALVLPTGDARFVNAAALPWARTVVVTEAAALHLSEEELDAVLAHEAAHLSEGPKVALLRLSAAALVLFALMPGLAIAFGLGFDRSGVGYAALFVFAALAFRHARRLARRMEERADDHAKAHLGGAPLASALRRLAELTQRPMVSGGKRVHPGLWDRLLSLGDDPGPKPKPLPRVAGFVLGGALFSAYLAAPATVSLLTDVTPEAIATLSTSAAKSRLLVDPWDGEAMLALGWRAREDGALDVAFARAEAAGRMGADPQSFYLLWSELSAADGDCEGARQAFEASLTAEAAAAFDDPFGNLSLGNYTLPPTLVTECELTMGEAFGEGAMDESGASAP
jgi:Zn-dependent protease with chaperone function